MTGSSLASKVVTVIGGGGVGSTLANAILNSGKAKDVLIAARDPAKTKTKLTEAGFGNLKVERVESAISVAEILILATPGAHTDEEIKQLAESLGDVGGKTLIDVTNPLSGFEDGLQYRWKHGTSGGEKLQEYLPETKVYKAFNTFGVEHMKDAVGKDCLYCGPDTDIEDVIAAVGHTPYYVGPIRYARNLEVMAELWVHCAIPPLPAKNMGRDWTYAIAGNPEN